MKTVQREEVRSSGELSLPANRVWSLLRDFHGTWHPAIKAMVVESDDHGHSIRAFTVHNDDTTYKERLSWFSDSDKNMAYTHLAGIEGVHDYTARLTVTPINDSQCTVTMSAQLAAPAPQAARIANGTKAIFDDGIAALKALTFSDLPTSGSTTKQLINTAPQIKLINAPHALAVSYLVGENTDTLCLFLHGIGGNKNNWLEQLRAVAPFCTAAAMDLRGYGDSTLGENQTHIDDYCTDILAVAESFNAKNIILCGLSYGAWIATSFAVRYPERLTALVLSGGCTGMSEASHEERTAFRESREAPLQSGKTPADFADDVVAVIAGPNCPDTVKNALLASMQAIPSSTYADALHCFTSPTEQFDFSLISMPVLLMTGDADRLAPAADIRDVAQRIHQRAPNADVRFECLDNAGHVCNLEAPESYNSALVSLVQRVVS